MHEIQAKNVRASTLRSLERAKTYRGTYRVLIAQSAARSWSYRLVHYHDDGWVIIAGCRTWWTLAAMRRHYGPSWRKDTAHTWDWSEAERQEYRKEALAFADKIERFIKKHKIVLRGDKAAKARAKKAAKKRRKS